MGVRTLQPAWTGVAGMLLLAGCASTAIPPDPPPDPTNLAALSAIDCKTFAEKASQNAANPGILVSHPSVSSAAGPAYAKDPLELVNRTAPVVSAGAGHADSGAGSGDGSDADDDAEVPVVHPLLDALPLFSEAVPVAAMPPGSAARLPAGWQPWTINRNKAATRYALTEVDQRLVLHAEADSSASGLYVPLAQRNAGAIRWTWKTRDVIRNADNSQKQREDAPLRLFVAFDGDHSTLSLRDQLMLEMARITTGREMPYATLMYIWGGRRAEGTVLPNPYTDRVRMIVVDSGSRHANQWRCHERDLRADYRKAFGTEPGKVIAVGLMTDTDNTRSRVEAWYGDIALD